MDYESDYCINRPENMLFQVGNNGEPLDKFPLSHCEGDCDNDEECSSSLLCQQRSDLEEVPGCDGIGRDGTDYCRYPSPDDDNYTSVGLCETGEDKWQGPEPTVDNLAVSFFVFGDTPYDDSCDSCNTCIGNDGNKEDHCEQFDCTLKIITMAELDPANTCTYEGPDYDCLENGIMPYMQSKIGVDVSFVAHVGDILSESNKALHTYISSSVCSSLFLTSLWQRAMKVAVTGAARIPPSHHARFSLTNPRISYLYPATTIGMK